MSVVLHDKLEIFARSLRRKMDNDVIALVTLIIMGLSDSDQQIQLLLDQHRRSNDVADNLLLFISALSSSNEEHRRIDGFCDVWLPTYLASDFFALFRMTRETFLTLMQKVDCPELHKVYTGGGKQVPAETQLLMTLWWLGKGETLISISDRFDVCLSTVYNCTGVILKRTICIILRVMFQNFQGR